MGASHETPEPIAPFPRADVERASSLPDPRGVSSLAARACAALVIAGCSGGLKPSPPERSPPRALSADPAADGAALRARALATMKRATRFMVERVSYRGGYVWAYLDDLSRRWGEMEAYPTMIWVQPPGTASVGHVLLDAHRATGDDDYYVAAARAGDALIAGQHPSGGWNYMIDFAGEASLRRWYATIGKNGWRLEEFHHYYGNATFDDGGTAESTRFLLRLYLVRRDARYREAADRALRFVLDAQHANGCWPQRHPMSEAQQGDGQPGFPAYVTFNDNVAAENIDVLAMFYQALGDARVLEPIRRAMDCFLRLQRPAPQAGWSPQYGPDLEPAAARSYEPAGLSTKITAQNVAELMNFTALTGESKYLEPIPAALAWLESVRRREPPEGYPALVAVGSNLPLFVHRRGSNATNGEYYVDDDPRKTIVHTKQIRPLDVEGLRARYLELTKSSSDAAARGSPLLTRPTPPALPRFFTGLELPMSRPTRSGASPERPSAALVARLAQELSPAGYWPTKLERVSHPYRGPAPRAVSPGDFSESEVGDAYDTSPYRSEEAPIGVSTKTFIENLSVLARYVDRE